MSRCQTKAKSLKMNKLILGFILLVTVQYLPAQTLKEGISQFENDNVAGARKVFFSLLKQDAKNAGALFYLGEIFYLDDNLDSAGFYWNKVNAASPESYFAHIANGTLALEQNKTGEAEKAFAKARKSVKEKDLPEVLGLIGNAYLSGRYPNYSKAEASYREARDLDTKNPRYFVGYGDALLANDKVGEALSSYELASNKDKDNPEILMKIARAYYKNGVGDVAIEQLESGIQRFPNYAPAYKELYQLYFAKGQYSKVTPLLEKYVALVGDDVEQRARLVKFLCFQAKDYKKAIEEANIVLQQQPDNYTMYRWLAWANFEEGNFQPAFDASKQFFELVGNRPVYASDHEYYAKAAAKLNNPQVAIDNFKAVVALDSTRTDVYEMIAKALYDGKKWPEAEVAYLDKITKGKPTNQDYYYLGMSRYQQNKNIEADSAFARLTEIQPTYATGWLMRARSNNRLDPDRKTFQAKPFYEKYLELVGTDMEKVKKQVVEANNYIGYFFSQNNDLTASIVWYEKSIALDPANEEAKNALEQLKAATGGK